MIENIAGGTVITGTHIELYAMATQRAALKLEIVGLKMSRGRSVYGLIKQAYGFKGNKQKVLEQLEARIAEFKALHPAGQA